MFSTYILSKLILKLSNRLSKDKRCAINYRLNSSIYFWLQDLVLLCTFREV